MRKSKSFRYSFGSRRESNTDSDMVNELKKNLSKSIEFGNALLEENEALREEIVKYQVTANDKIIRSFEEERDQLITTHSLEKENFEQEIADIRLELNNYVSSSAQLIHEKDGLARDLELTKKDLKRVMKNNDKLRKEKVKSNYTEKFLTRRLSMDIDLHELDDFQAPLQKCSSFGSISPPPKSGTSSSYSTPHDSPSKSPLRSHKIKNMSESSYLELKRSCSKRRVEESKKKGDRVAKALRRRVMHGFHKLRESVDDVKQCVFQHSVWWSQKRFVISRNMSADNISKEEKHRSEVKKLEERIRRLELEITKKDEKYVKQISNFLEMFEVNKIYEGDD